MLTNGSRCIAHTIDNKWIIGFFFFTNGKRTVSQFIYDWNADKRNTITYEVDEVYPWR